MKLVSIKNRAYRNEIVKHCPNCGSILNTQVKGFITMCKVCRGRVNLLVPSKIQSLSTDVEGHEIYKCGCVRTGKTLSSANKVAHHLLTIPYSHCIVCAPTLVQVTKIARPEIEKFIHEDDIFRASNVEIVLKNGSKITFITSKDPDSMKGFTASCGWMIEANSMSSDIYKELKSRISSPVGYTYKLGVNNEIIYEDDKPILLANKNFIIIEFNPQPCWCWENILSCDIIYHTPGVPIDKFKHLLGETKGLKKIAILEDIDSLVFQPQEYIDGTKAKYGKDEEELMREQLYCDINGTTSLIHPKLISKVIEPFKIERHYKIGYITDFGSNIAKTTMLVVAFDPQEDKWYIVECYYRNDLPYTIHASNMKKIKEKYVNHDNLFHTCDPAGKQTKGVTGVTDISDYRKCGVYLKPVSNSSDGISIINGLLENNKLFVFNSNVDLLDEYRSYAYSYREINGRRSKFIPAENKKMRFDIMDTLKYFGNTIGVDPKEWNSYKRDMKKLNKYTYYSTTY